MAGGDFDINEFRLALDSWHSEVSMICKGLNRVLWELKDDSQDSEFSSIGYVLIERFKVLVETCPFPPFDA